MKNLMFVILVGILFSASLSAVTEPAEETEKQAEQTKLIVVGVVPESPHEKAGVMPNDVLIRYNGKPLNTLNELNELKEQVTSESLEVIFLRAEKEIIVKIAQGQTGVYLKEFLPDIKYKKDAVVIDGIPSLGWETRKTNTFFASLEAVANHLGIKKDYTEINGISGTAFRTHFCQDWCPSSPDPTCGFNSGEEALKALGLEYKVMHLSTDGKNKPEIKKAILESIDKNISVIALDLIKTPEWGLVTGYQDNGEELLCRTYFDRRNSYEIAEKFPWALYIITGKKDMVEDIELYQQSFKTVLANLTTEKYDQYYSGINAFNQWVEHLEKTDFAKLDSEKFTNVALANAWIWDRLISDRNDAVVYLKKAVEVIPDLSTPLDELKTIYEEEAKMLQGSPNIIIYPFVMKSREDWTLDMRKQEVAVLQKAKVKEEAALKIWQEIVKKEGENK